MHGVMEMMFGSFRPMYSHRHCPHGDMLNESGMSCLEHRKKLFYEQKTNVQKDEITIIRGTRTSGLLFMRSFCVIDQKRF